MEDVVARIEQWMQKKGMTAPELAKALDMNRSTVIHIMNGRNKPSLQLIINLASYDPEMDLRFLLTGEYSPTPSATKATKVEKVETKVIEKIKEVGTGKNTMIVLHSDGTYKSFVEQQ
jgi:transcriptional regulator with XRE-family HTH domain